MVSKYFRRCACCAAIFRFRFTSFWTQTLGIQGQSLVYNLYAKYSSLRGFDIEAGALMQYI